MYVRTVKTVSFVDTNGGRFTQESNLKYFKSILKRQKDITTIDMAEESNAVPSKDEVCTFCSYRGLETKAEFFCDSCSDALYCQACATSHKKIPRFKSHDVKPLVAFFRHRRCDIHGGRDMKLLCMGCDRPVCEICAGVDHSDHELVDIGGVMKQISDTFEPLNDAKLKVSAIQEELQDIRKREEGVFALVKEQAELIIDEVRKRRDQLVSEIMSNAAGAKMSMEMANLGKSIEEVMKQSQDIFATGVNNVQQFQAAASINDTLTETRLDAERNIGIMIKNMKITSVPRFSPEKDMTLGKLDSVDMDIIVTNADPVKLQLGGTYRRHPCYRIPKAVMFMQERGNETQKEVAFLEQQDKRGELRMAITEGGKLAEWRRSVDKAVDLIINTDEKLVILCNGQKNREYVPCVKIYNGNGGYHSSKWLSGLPHVRGKTALSLAQTKSGNYVVLCKYYPSRYSIYLLNSDFTMLVGPINLDTEVTNLIQDGGLKIRCPGSTDMLLIQDGKGEQIIALSLQVRHGSLEYFHNGSAGDLVHFLKEMRPILPPIQGYYILDMCCDGGKVYLCIKRQNRTRRSPEAGPLLFYEARFTANKWVFTSIPVFDPTGRSFGQVEREELLHLGVRQATLMCLLYSPIPLTELKEKRDPGMYVTWYQGKLP
ncbi:uncharacterized protein LOC135493365 [Lineus longissimus]|uniref:uncharacterized protein LOC135493365 n=1 Tax=Lineus longissimus TaxID=88925 RepID=UPI00315D0803